MKEGQNNRSLPFAFLHEVDICKNLERIRTTVEHSISESLHNKIRKADEHSLADFLHGGGNCQLCERAATIKRFRPYTRHTLGNRNTLEKAAAFKRSIVYARHAIRNNNARLLLAIANIDMIHYDVTVRVGKPLAAF